MSDLDAFDYECPGQISLFDGWLKEYCDTKPEIGTDLVFHYKGKDYACVVDKHCGADFFYVRFKNKQLSLDFPELGDVEGWHISLKGYKRSWDYPDKEV